MNFADAVQVIRKKCESLRQKVVLARGMSRMADDSKEQRELARKAAMFEAQLRDLRGSCPPIKDSLPAPPARPLRPIPPTEKEIDIPRSRE